MITIVMPRLSDSMQEGTILKWLVADGEPVSRGDELAEIETDKATMSYEADGDGLVHHVAREGDVLPVGATIALLLSPGEEAPSDGTNATASRPAAATNGHTGTAGTPASSSSGGSRMVAAAAPGAAVKASPVARRLAGELGIDLTGLVGSGPNGRIVRADVEQAAVAPEAPTSEVAAAEATPSPAAVETAKGDITRQELTRLQQVVARRMVESRATIPDFTIATEVDMEACVALRAQLKALAPEAVPSYNDMVVKACASALRAFPRANGAYRDGHFELFSRVNVGIAVAAQDGLVVPTVFDADRKSLGDIARETRALASKVRDGTVTPAELSGGTFTVSNLGMYGVTEFNAVINPPQAAILAVGAMAPKPVVHNGEIVARSRMTLSLSCDHRMLYGANAAEFLARIRALLEEPLAALVFS